MNPGNEAPELTPGTPPVAGYCRMCGKALTEEQARRYQGTVYCPEHVPPPAAAASSAPPHAAPAPGTISPGLAWVLGLIPGVGAIYNGQYAKGFIHVLITGVLIGLADRGDVMFVLAVWAWFFYMAFEAYHTAAKRALGEPVDEFSSLFPGAGGSTGVPVAPLFLIGMGILLLLNQLEWIELHRLKRYVPPVVLISVGGYMLANRLRSSSTGSQGGGL